MTLSEYFALKHGNLADVARAIGAPSGNVSEWASGSRNTPAKFGAAIERATGGQVTRQELFPDTWERIWPELAAPSSDIHVIRRSQLRMLIDQRAAGNIAAFAEQFGYSRSRMSQFLSDTYNEGRSIGERAARALEEAAGLAFGWLDQMPVKTVFDVDLPGKFSGNSTVDHAAELRGAIAQTRLVFEGHRDAQDALEYLEQVLKAGQLAEVPAHACAPADRAAAAMAAESAQLVIQAEKAAAGAAARATVDPVAVLSREVFSLSEKLQQPADLVVQLLVLKQLRDLQSSLSIAQFGARY